MSTIEEKEYWKVRGDVRDDITVTRNELLDLITKKSILERRLEQDQQRLSGLNRALLNEDYYLQFSTFNSEADEFVSPIDPAFSRDHELIPFHYYADAGEEGNGRIQIFGQVRTVHGFKQDLSADKPTSGPQRTGRYIVGDSGHAKHRLSDELIARLYVEDPVGFRSITIKDKEGQILINGAFGVVPGFDEAVTGKIYTSESAYYQALSKYYMYLAKIATLKSRAPNQWVAMAAH